MLLHFPTRRRGATVPPRWRVELRNGDRRRVYEIQPAGQPGVMQTWVRFDGQAHRAQLTRSSADLESLRAQFEREIAELERDGWTRLP